MKITPNHLARGAFVYIRKSTTDQLANNHESRRRQYGLAERARALGWTDVTVIDDDLGRSGSGVSRPGFERLLAAICEGRVGAVTRFVGSARDREISSKRCRGSASVGSAITRRGATMDSPIQSPALLLRHLIEISKLYPTYRYFGIFFTSSDARARSVTNWSFRSTSFACRNYLRSRSTVPSCWTGADCEASLTLCKLPLILY
jgi:hypothetical protein